MIIIMMIIMIIIITGIYKWLNIVNVRLSNRQLKKLKDAVKDNTETTFTN